MWNGLELPKAYYQDDVEVGLTACVACAILNTKGG